MQKGPQSENQGPFQSEVVKPFLETSCEPVHQARRRKQGQHHEDREDRLLNTKAIPRRMVGHWDLLLGTAVCDCDAQGSVDAGGDYIRSASAAVPSDDLVAVQCDVGST